MSWTKPSTNDRSWNWWMWMQPYSNIYGVWDWALRAHINGDNQHQHGNKKWWQCCTSDAITLAHHMGRVYVSMLNGVRIKHILFAWLSHKLFGHICVTYPRADVSRSLSLYSSVCVNKQLERNKKKGKDNPQCECYMFMILWQFVNLVWARNGLALSQQTRKHVQQLTDFLSVNRVHFISFQFFNLCFALLYCLMCLPPYCAELRSECNQKENGKEMSCKT